MHQTMLLLDGSTNGEFGTPGSHATLKDSMVMIEILMVVAVVISRQEINFIGLDTGIANAISIKARIAGCVALLDNFLTPTQVRQACRCIAQLDANGKFASNPNSQNSERDDDGEPEALQQDGQKFAGVGEEFHGLRPCISSPRKAPRLS